MPGPLRQAHMSLLRNDAVLRALEAHVEARHAAGMPASAVAWSFIAGEFAMRNHPGRFCSPRIERVLAEIGATLPAVSASRPREVRRVLHVLTEAYDTGGHSRLAWRWMQRDAARHHEAVLTRPGRRCPARLSAAAAAVHVLDAPSDLGRAIQLRTLAARFDLVVLHAHPYDAVPVLAFAARDDGPPVVFVDHADHLFWLGVGVADVVTACRRPAGELQVGRRGIAADRSVLLPVPAERGQRRACKADAKAVLGAGAGDEVLLTVAVPHKFAPVVTPTFFDAVTAALRARPSARLVAVGPEARDEAWAALASAFPGRVLAVGRQADLQLYWDAADAYLDSYPFSSNTSAIEAASHGLPVVSFCPDPAVQGLLLTHDPGFEDAVLRAADPGGYADAVAAALDDPEALGAQLQAGFVAAHDGDGWRGRLEAVYTRALAVCPASPPPGDLYGTHAPVAWEALHHLLFEATGTTGPLAVSVLAHRARLPYDEAPTTDEQLLMLCRWDGIARVDPDAGSASRAVDALRTMRDAGVLESCTVTVAPDALDTAIPHLEAALTAGDDFPLDVVPTSDTAPAVGARPLLIA